VKIRYPSPSSISGTVKVKLTFIMPLIEVGLGYLTFTVALIEDGLRYVTFTVPLIEDGLGPVHPIFVAH
jgi:hypothetical protein